MCFPATQADRSGGPLRVDAGEGRRLGDFADPVEVGLRSSLDAGQFDRRDIVFLIDRDRPELDGAIVLPFVGYALVVVCTEKLNPRVVMVKSGQDGVRTYGTGSLNRPRIRRIFV